MKESAVSQRILAEGEALGLARAEAQGELKGLRSSLILIASVQFGTPNERQLGEVNQIAEAPKLKAMVSRVFRAKSWVDLIVNS